MRLFNARCAQSVFNGIVLALLLGFALSTAQAKVLSGKVVNIADGDTVTVLYGKQTYRIRLAQIDAPETDQPGGKAAKHWLTARVAQQQVQVHYDEQDRYGRIVGELLLDGVNINRELVGEGHAWAYQRYLKDRDLLQLQQMAKAQRRGLWSQANPIAPWRWRRGER